MPRRHSNAREREERQWSTEYIKMLMKKLHAGAIEQIYEAPIVQPTIKERKRKDK